VSVSDCDPQAVYQHFFLSLLSTLKFSTFQIWCDPLSHYIFIFQSLAETIWATRSRTSISFLRSEHHVFFIPSVESFSLSQEKEIQNVFTVFSGYKIYKIMYTKSFQLDEKMYAPKDYYTERCMHTHSKSLFSKTENIMGDKSNRMKVSDVGDKCNNLRKQRFLWATKGAASNIEMSATSATRPDLFFYFYFFSNMLEV